MTHEEEKPISRNPYYRLSDELIDVVIPCAGKDVFTLEQSIEGIRTHRERINRVIVVSDRGLTDKGEWLAETVFPFDQSEIASRILNTKEAGEYLQHPKNRAGWILQQLIKLYAPLVIPDISSNVLILDADTVFLNPVSFLNSRNGAFFTKSREFHAPYFEHAGKLIPGFKKMLDHSAIAHHMLFQEEIIRDLFTLIEAIHRKPFWQAFCDCIDPMNIFRSPCSEYEIYANFALMRSTQPEVRELKWKNVRGLKNLARYRDAGYDYVSCHAYMRTSVSPSPSRP